MEHGLVGIGTPQQFFLFLTGTRLRYRHVKCHSFHWQDVPIPPLSKGRMCSVTIQTDGEGGNTLHPPMHPVSCQGIIQRPKRCNMAQALGAGILSVYRSVSS